MAGHLSRDNPQIVAIFVQTVSAFVTWNSKATQDQNWESTFPNQESSPFSSCYENSNGHWKRASNWSTLHSCDYSNLQSNNQVLSPVGFRGYLCTDSHRPSLFWNRFLIQRALSCS